MFDVTGEHIPTVRTGGPTQTQAETPQHIIRIRRTSYRWSHLRLRRYRKVCDLVQPPAVVCEGRPWTNVSPSWASRLNGPCGRDTSHSLLHSFPLNIGNTSYAKMKLMLGISLAAPASVSTSVESPVSGQERKWTDMRLVSTYIGIRCLGRASLAFNRLKVTVSPRRSVSSFLSSVFTTPHSLRRALSTTAESRDNLFDYTSGRWM